ncbi:bacterio-opsin activator domain-containing protein [Natrialbaceae archaeon A-CW2]
MDDGFGTAADVRSGNASGPLSLVGDGSWAEAIETTVSETDFDLETRRETAASVLDSERAGSIVFEPTATPDGAVAFAEAVRDRWPACPLICVPREGGESLAGAVLAAGATGYVPFDERESLLEGALDSALEASLDVPSTSTARREESPTLDADERAPIEADESPPREADVLPTHRDRSPYFDAIESGPEFLWILERDGTIVEANDTVRTELEGASDANGRPFPAASWWPVSAGRPLETAVEAALEGEFSSREVTLEDGDRTLSLALYPVLNGDDGVVVVGRDITERASTIRELRRSEELHRVTLAHMTDTVLLTDETGAFTYVCPNVHFIFGYTAEEIYELGTIDALLGEGLYDEDELARSGVLTNVECTATDRSGTEHHLLVNIREVSIQDGRTLFSCRDVTTRKQREQALTSLQETAQALLYAETRHEVATRVVDDAGPVLDLPSAAMYLFDADENVLRPSAFTGHREGPDRGKPEATWPGADDVVATSFVEDEHFVIENFEGNASPMDRLESGVVIPLGDHGVFVAGTTREESIDTVTSEVANLLAATAEAALDRVERDMALRERDRELNEQNQRLSALNRINEIIREIGQELVQAETRSAIEEAVCARLTADDRFAFAWIGSRDRHTGSLTPRAWAGDDETYLDALETESITTEPGQRTLETGEPTVVENVADDLRADPWRSVALTRGFQSVVSVPLAYDEFGYGALTVYGTQAGAVDETAQAVLRELGEMIASAIGSVERTHALLGGRAVELTYESETASTTVGRLARTLECQLDLEGGVQRLDSGVLAFITVTGCAAHRVVEQASTLVSVASAQVVSATEDGGLVRLTLVDPLLVTRLAEHGAVITALTATPSGTTLSIEIPSTVETASVDDLVRTVYSDATLVARRERGGAPTTGDRLESEVRNSLTDRQLEVVRTAYHAGFFETPRTNSGAEVASTLDISPTAFSKHVRAVERTLFSVLFDEAHPRRVE